MAQVDTNRAIGAVTRLLADHLNRRTGLVVVSGRPESAAGADSSRLNLFLYEIGFDASMRNVPLRESEPAPLWLVMKYLLTGFDDDGESDGVDAHDVLGLGLSALQELAMIQLDPNTATQVRSALESNPEPLKITFEQTPPDLLNKIMQASDDEYRLSVAFEVRPVLIVPPEPTHYTLLVGVDYTAGAPTDQPDYVGTNVLASLGPTLRSVDPPAFTVGDEVTLRGDDLHLSNLSCWLEAVELEITMQRPDEMIVAVPDAVGSGVLIAAGEHPLVLRQDLPESGRHRRSNLQIGRLLPIVTSAAPGAFTEDSDGFLAGPITIDGLLLGRAQDTIQAALFVEGTVVATIEVEKTPPAEGDPPDSQTQLTVNLSGEHQVPAGTYLVIVVVNGQQARFSPTITIAP